MDNGKGFEGMENSGLALFVGGIVITLFLVMGGAFNLRRHDMKTMESIDAMTSTGTRVWSYLTPEQQDELKSIESLLVQEEWLEEQVEQEVLGGVSAERVLIEFANRGFIILGQGVFRRHSSPLDYIDPKAPPITEAVEVFEGPLTKEDTEKALMGDDIGTDSSLEESAVTTGIKEEEQAKVVPPVIISKDDCEQCKHILQDFAFESAPVRKKLPEIAEN